jgi:hypothetical protein
MKQTSVCTATAPARRAPPPWNTASSEPCVDLQEIERADLGDIVEPARVERHLADHHAED